ncbi:MAG: ATP-grasp domain-containing protein, partial [Thermoplasmatota archaeon]
LRHRGLPIDADWADVVMPRIGTSVTGPGVTVVRQFEAMGVPVINPSMGIIRARDKLRSLQVLSRSRVDMPKTAFIQNVNDLDAAIEQVGGVPCVVKLLQGTQGIGVMLAESRSALESMLQAFWSLGHSVLLQEYIKESKGKDVRAFVVGDRVVAAMRREAPMGEFRSNIHRGGIGRSVRLSEDDEATVIEASQAIGLHVAGVDYLESHNGPKIIEVNASPGFQGLERATNVDIAAAVVEYAEHFLEVA